MEKYKLITTKKEKQLIFGLKMLMEPSTSGKKQTVYLNQ